MTTINAQLKDKSGNSIYPKTLGSVVLNNNGDSLGGVEANAQVNVISTVKVNGSSLTPDANKAVNVSVPSYTLVQQQTADTGDAYTYYLASGGSAVTGADKIHVPQSTSSAQATDTTAGSMKLYQTLGTNTDGAVSQATIGSGITSWANITDGDGTVFLQDNTTLTVAASGADFTSLQDAIGYLTNKYSSGTVTISISGSFTPSSPIEIDGTKFNISNLKIEGGSFTFSSATSSGAFIISDVTGNIRLNTTITGSSSTAGGKGVVVHNSPKVQFYALSEISSFEVGIELTGMANAEVNGVVSNSSVGLYVEKGSKALAWGSMTSCTTGAVVYKGGTIIDDGITFTTVTNSYSQVENTFTSSGVIYN